MAGPSDPLRHALEHGEYDSELTAAALIALSAREQSAEARLAAARYLDAFDNDDGRHDHGIVVSLAPLLERESSFESTERYLEAAHTLAEVSLRHQRWAIASNALLILESRLPMDSVPPWVRVYRTKLFFRLEPDTAFTDPDITLSLLGSVEALDAQGTAVVREYLAQARTWFRSRGADDARVRFAAAATGLLETILPSVDDLLQYLQSPESVQGDDGVGDRIDPVALTPPPAPRRASAPPTPKRTTVTKTPVSPAATPAGDTTPMPDVLPAAESAEPGEHKAPPSSLEATRAQETDTSAHRALIAENEQLRLALAQLERERDAQTQTGVASDTEPSGEPTDPPADGTFNLGRRHILVLGAGKPGPSVLHGIAKQYGISKEQLEFASDYDKLTQFDLESLRYSAQCAGVLIGAVPHKMRNVGTATSPVELLRDGDGFPPSVPMYAGSELKITKTSFRRALEELRDQMLANGAPTVRAEKAARPLVA